MKKQLGSFFATLVGGLAATFALNALYAASAPPLAITKAISEEQGAGDIVVSDNTLYQRGWLRARLQKDCVDVVVFGSSTVGTLSQEMLAPHRMLNAWTGNASIQDVESFVSILRGAPCRPKVVVLGTDLWWTGNPAWTFDGWQQLVDDYVAYQGAHGRMAAFVPWKVRWDGFKENVSFERTLDTVRAVRTRGWSTDPRARANLRVLPGPEDVLCDKAEGDLNLRSHDGHYTKCPRSMASAAYVDRFSDEYLVANIHNMADWHELAHDRIERLAIAVQDLEASGTHVVMVGMPYHARAWAKLSADPTVGPLVAELDGELTRVASRTNATFLTLRDPTRVGCAAEEFDDSHHARPPCTRKVAARLREVLSTTLAKDGSR